MNIDVTTFIFIPLAISILELKLSSLERKWWYIAIIEIFSERFHFKRNRLEW